MRIPALAAAALLVLGTTAANADPPKGKGPHKEMPPQAGPKKDAPAPAPAASAAETAKAEMKDAKGAKVGEATLVETPHGVLVTLELSGAPAGAHAFHIHETGKCEPPFKTAGGHFNPEGHKHGVMNPEGKHAGDMPNVYVSEGGKGRYEVFVPGVTLKPGPKNSLFDADGAALVIHDKADDNKSDPAGAAGDRIACGVVTK